MEKKQNGLVLALVVVVLFFLFGSLGMGSYGMMGFGMGFGFIFMLIFWGVLIGLVITVINASRSGGSNSDSQSDSPLEILKKRYARGEINKKKFEERKKDLIA